MSIEPIERISKRILAQYNRNPESWTVLADRRSNVLVIGPDGSFRLKLVPLGPHKHIGVGVEIGQLGNLQGIVKGASSYGFRPLSMEETETLLKAVRQGNLEKSLVNRLLGMTPVSTTDLQKMKPEMVLSGPVVLHPDLSTISDGQRNLEKKLTVEADRLFRKRYPLRAGIYR